MKNSKKDTRFSAKKWLLFALVILFAGSVSAQKAKVDSSASKLSSQSKLANGVAFLKNIRRIHKAILPKLKKARADNDLPAVECYGEKLTNIRALWFTAEKAFAQLQEAIAKNEGEKANFHYTTVAQSEAQCRNIELKAKTCKGIGGVYSGKTKVILTGVDPRSKGDPTLPPWTAPIIADRPTGGSTIF